MNIHKTRIFDFQESLLHEMWQDLKFAVNWKAGDTKPIVKPGSSASRIGSRSILSKSNADSLNKYGVIPEDVKSCRSNTSKRDSTYATFNEQAPDRMSHQGIPNGLPTE